MGLCLFWSRFASPCVCRKGATIGLSLHLNAQRNEGRHKAAVGRGRSEGQSATSRKRGPNVFRGIGGGGWSPYGDYERQVSQRFEVLAGSLLKAGAVEREATLKDVEATNPGLANRLRQFLDRSQDQQQSFLQHLDSQQPADKEKGAGWPSAGWNAWRDEMRDIQDQVMTVADQQQSTMQTWMDKQQAAVAKLTEHQQEAIKAWTDNQKAALDKLAERQKALLDTWRETLTSIQVVVPQVPDVQQAIGLLGQPKGSIVFTPEEVPVMGTEPTVKGRVTAYAATGVLPDVPDVGVPLHIVSGILGRKTLTMTTALDAYSKQTEA